jgi:leucyl aminopeptidase (aminopeptidase T)
MTVVASTQVTLAADMLADDFAALRSGEKVLIVTDLLTDPAAAAAIGAAANARGCEVTVVEVAPRAVNGDPFPDAVEAACRVSDVIFALASTDILHSLVWGPGATLRDIRDRPWRLVEMSEASTSVLARSANRAAYDEVARITTALLDEVKEGSRIRITSPAGTDLAGTIRAGLAGGLSVGANMGRATTPGSWCCFPDGEVYILAPGCLGGEGDTSGVVVFDTAMHMLGRLDEPIACTVTDGRVVGIDGGWQAERLRRILASVPNSNHIIELGSIATNPAVTPHGESMFEDRKSLGTAHVAVGNPYPDMYDADGVRRTSFVHLDGVISGPTIWVDDRLILEKGRIICIDETQPAGR